MSWRPSRLALRLAGAVVLVVAVTGTMTTWFLTLRLSRQVESQFVDRGRSLSMLLARLVSEGIAEEKLDLVNRAAYLLKEPGVLSIRAYTEFWDLIDVYPAGERHSHSISRARDFFADEPARQFFVEAVPGRGGYDFYARVLYRPYADSPSLAVGFVKLDISAAALVASRSESVRLHLVAAAVIGLLSIILFGLLLHVLVIRPIHRLRGEMASFSQGGGRRAYALEKRDEMGDLARQFDRMARVIEEREQALAEKSRYLGALLTASDRGIIATDADLLVRYFNPRAEEIYHRSAATVIGRTVAQIHRQEHVDPVRLERGIDLAKERGSYTYTVRQQDDDGRALVFASTIFPIDRGAAGFMLLVEEITAQLEATARVQESEIRNRALLDAISDGLVIVDREGVVTRWNDTAARMTGCPDLNLQDAYLPGIFFAGEERRRFYRWFEKPFFSDATRNGPELVQFTASRRDGGAISVEISISPCQVGDQWHGVIILRDISKRLEYIREIERSNQELEQFAYVASHDLQEPLRVISGFIQLLEKRLGTSLDKDGREYMAFIIDAATRMKELINDLLAYSRVGTRAKQPEAVDLNAAMTRVRENLAPLAEEQGGLITWDALPTVQVEPVQIVQLLQNLVANALRYHRPEKPPRVHVSAAVRLGGGWTVSVADNGIGIEPRCFDRIFMIFKRLHTREEYPGTGIGLAICKKIVERHGGRLWVESTPGQGAVFSFTLPGERPARPEKSAPPCPPGGAAESGRAT